LQSWIDIILWTALTGPERVVEIVVSNVLSELYPSFSRTAVVQPRPQSGLDDFTPQLFDRIEVAYRVEVSREAAGMPLALQAA
jgi:hypothetical protein